MTIVAGGADGAKAPCFVCNVARSAAMKSVGIDGALIVGIVHGYAQARTRDEIDWVGADACERHARMIELAAASVARSLLKGDGE